VVYLDFKLTRVSVRVVKGLAGTCTLNPTKYPNLLKSKQDKQNQAMSHS
jgi:hypothetical protein